MSLRTLSLNDTDSISGQIKGPNTHLVPKLWVGRFDGEIRCSSCQKYIERQLAWYCKNRGILLCDTCKPEHKSRFIDGIHTDFRLLPMKAEENYANR